MSVFLSVIKNTKVYNFWNESLKWVIALTSCFLQKYSITLLWADPSIMRSFQCALRRSTMSLSINLFSNLLSSQAWSSVTNFIIAYLNNSYEVSPLLLLENSSHTMQRLLNTSTVPLAEHLHLTNSWLESRCYTELSLLFSRTQCPITSMETGWEFLRFFSIERNISCLPFLPLVRRHSTTLAKVFVKSVDIAPHLHYFVVTCSIPKTVCQHMIFSTTRY